MKKHLHVRDRGGNLINANAVRSLVQKQLDKKVIKELATTVAMAVNDAVRACKYETEVKFERILEEEELASITNYLKERNFEQTGSKTVDDVTVITVSWKNAVDSQEQDPDGDEPKDESQGEGEQAA